MLVSSSYFSETGTRTQNEDAVRVATLPMGTICASIADGVGGQRGGKFAAEFAVTEFEKMALNNPRGDLMSFVADIHQQLIQHVQADSNLTGAAAAFSGLVIIDGELRFAHTGDTRIMLFRGKGVQQLTEDHTEVHRLLKAGKLSWDEAESYPRKNVLESALGVRAPLKLQSGVVRLVDNDRIVLSTDGAHKTLRKQELLKISLDSQSAEILIEKSREALALTSADDNYTIAALDFRI